MIENPMFHFSGVAIRDGVPTVNLRLRFANNSSYSEEIILDLDSVEAAALAFTKALHMARMVREHTANCDRCTMEALGRDKHD